MILVFALTLILSAALLFVVQPLVAHMLLPSLGGSAAVWTACMLFFQAALLGGYVLAHIMARYVPERLWPILQVGGLLLAFTTLPFDLFNLQPDPEAPAIWVLKTLLLTVAPAFVLLSTTAPTLQTWFSRTSHKDANDPYFLYAASNVGSFAGLLGYPLLIEPLMGVTTQNHFWKIGYAFLAALIAACAFLTMKALRPATSQACVSPPSPLTLQTRLWWVVLAFIPSSLMLGLTQFLSTDLAAVPLLWVVPLGIYLSTFVLAFSPRLWRLPQWTARLLPPATLLIFGSYWLKLPVTLSIGLHLSLFFWAAWLFHEHLARLRPEAARVTEFFLLLSVGGMFGGLFNALIAPLIFTRAIEYWVILAAACALASLKKLREPEHTPDQESDVRALKQDPWRFVMVALFAISSLFLCYQSGLLDSWSAALFVPIIIILSGIAFTVPRMNRLAFALIALAATHKLTQTPGEVAAARSFFGAYKVFDRESPGGTVRRFSHGTTAHGAQILDKPELPVAYHHPDGPIGQVMRALADGTHRANPGPYHLGVVGLGIGAMAAYGNANRTMHFFEIDPLVEDLARAHFSYLSRCNDFCTVTIGDGRQRLFDVPDQHYDVLFLDAYNSDSVPTHLLTREAVQLYLKKVKPGGAIVFHVSNRYLNVQGLVGALAADAGLSCRAQVHHPDREKRRNEFAMTSSYVITSAEPATLSVLDERWDECPALQKIWTDDFANILSILD